MAMFYEWLAKSYDTNIKNVEDAINNKKAYIFLIVWTIFEQTCFNGYLRVSNISYFSATNISHIDICSLNKEIYHFFTRYQDPNKLKNLIHNDSANSYKDILSKKYESLTDEEKINLLIYVIFRFRNNIFHGNKGVMSWFNYKKEIDYCINSMMLIIDNVKAIRNSSMF